MTGAERGYLLLTSHLGDPERKPLSVSQLRSLFQKLRFQSPQETERELRTEDLIALGYGEAEAERILSLLSEDAVLEDYLRRAKKAGCVPLVRNSPLYPAVVRIRLGLDAPGCLWAKGDLSLLQQPCVALVGSRELRADNRDFAEEVGRQAALQGLTLVSGNARGADRTAQDACLAAGGSVICVVADAMTEHPSHPRILYLSEDGYDLAFTALRALSRNRVIHCLPVKTFVAQCNFGKGGTWDGTIRNLRFGWSGVFCFDDGSPAAREFEQMGAVLVTGVQLANIRSLQTPAKSLFDSADDPADE